MKHEDIDHTGLTGISSGAVATDAIYDAKGDIPIGTGANTSAKLVAGANGTTLIAASGETTGYKTAYPPGYEIDYVQSTAGNTAISGTTEGTAHTLVTGTSLTYTAEPIMITAFCARVNTGATANSGIVFLLYDGATILGRLGLILSGATNGIVASFFGAHRVTPTAATHQYILKAYRTTSNGSVDMSGGGTGVEMPGFIRVQKV